MFLLVCYTLTKCLKMKNKKMESWICEIKLWKKPWGFRKLNLLVDFLIFSHLLFWLQLIYCHQDSVLSWTPVITICIMTEEQGRLSFVKTYADFPGNLIDSNTFLSTLRLVMTFQVLPLVKDRVASLPQVCSLSSINKGTATTHERNTRKSLRW